MGEKNKTLTEEQKRVTAETCLSRVANAGQPASECERLPIFLSGTDVSAATKHDIKALAEQPGWVKLNYESVKTKEGKGEKPGWYNKFGGCPGEKTTGQQCDEYPFFATKQGGPAKTPPVSLEWIDGKENELQGSFYSGFQSSCVVPEGGAFLATPQLALPTFRVCQQ